MLAVAGTQALASGETCCRRNGDGSKLCPRWETECQCCRVDQTQPRSLWDPETEAFIYDLGKCAPNAENRPPKCPCCILPTTSTLSSPASETCSKEWRCGEGQDPEWTPDGPNAPKGPRPRDVGLAIAIPLPLALGGLFVLLVLNGFFRKSKDSLVGTVRDDYGRPIVGAQVSFHRKHTTTDFRGQYMLSVKPGATGKVSAAKVGYVNDGRGSKRIRMPKNASQVMPEGSADLMLVTPRVVSGIVRSNNGVSEVALPKAQVSICNASGKPTATCTTFDVYVDGKPNYRLELLPGEYLVTFTATGHESKDERLVVPAGTGSAKAEGKTKSSKSILKSFSSLTSFSIFDDAPDDEPKSSEVTLDVILVPFKCTLTGIVTDASTGAPLMGATVSLSDDNGEEVRAVTCDRSGRYEARRVPCGMYTRRVFLSGYDTHFDALELDERAEQLDAKLSVSLYDLFGTITSESKAAGEDPSRGPTPLSGAEVKLLVPGSYAVLSTCVTDGSGAYALAAPPGTYTLVATAGDHGPSQTDDFELTHDDQVQDVNLLAALFSISGTVIDSDAADAPIAGAHVVLRSADGEKALASTESSDLGEFKFDVTPGSYRVRVSKASYLEDARKVEVAVADVTHMVQLKQASHVVTGVVTNVDGAPLGALVELRDSSSNVVGSARTDEMGAYTLNAPPGAFTWAVSASGCIEVTRPISLSDDMDGVDVVLEPITHTVVGMITDAVSKKPIPDVALVLAPSLSPAKDFEGEEQDALELESAATPIQVEGASGADGRFSLNRVRVGRYTLSCTVAGYVPTAGHSVVVRASSGASNADQAMARRSYFVQGRISEAETGEPVFDAIVTQMTGEGKKEKAVSSAEPVRTNEAGLYVLNRLTPGPHKLCITADGFEKTTISFTSVEEDMRAGGPADAILEAKKFKLSGKVTSGEDGEPPSARAVAWLKRNGKIKQRVECSSDGVYDFGEVAGGLYNVVAGAPAHMKMRVAVTVTAEVKPGSGEADLCLPKPLPPETDIGCQLAEHVHAMKAIFQFYCSAAVVGSNNPFMMSMGQVEEFMMALKLPDGLSDSGSMVIQKLFEQVNGCTETTFRFDQKGNVQGGLRPDSEKAIDSMLAFDEFLDLQVQLAWLTGKMNLLPSKSFPHSRRGLGYALKQYVDEILKPRAESLEVDPDFEEQMRDFKMPSVVGKTVAKAFEASTKNKAKAINVDTFTDIVKKWRAIGSKMSILRVRTLFVQYADPSRGKVPYFVRDMVPAAETVKQEEALMFEEELDDDIMEAKLAAAQRAKLEANMAAEAAGSTVVGEKDALSVMEDAAGERGVPREPTQEMNLNQFKAVVCRLAWVMCKGKTLGDRVETFAGMYIK